MIMPCSGAVQWVTSTQRSAEIFDSHLRMIEKQAHLRTTEGIFRTELSRLRTQRTRLRVDLVEPVGRLCR